MTVAYENQYKSPQAFKRQDLTINCKKLPEIPSIVSSVVSHVADMFELLTV